jgi:hypothetical protein
MLEAFLVSASDDESIRETREAESRRGKRPVDLAERKRRAEFRRKFKQILESNDVELFKEALINDLGQQQDTPEFQNSMKIWRDFHGQS